MDLTKLVQLNICPYLFLKILEITSEILEIKCKDSDDSRLRKGFKTM